MIYVVVVCLCAIISPAIGGFVHTRILGGRQENINLIPYQVAISHNDLPLCSGSIIAPKWILTAAHCLNALKNYPVDVVLKIRAGSANQFTGGVVVPVSKFFIHRLFNEDTYDSDIALVQLTDALVYNETVQPVTLPENGWDVPVGKAARISGWGKSETQLQSILLRSTEVFPVTVSSCKRSYGNHITDNMFCAGFIGGGRDFCVGDSGGPLVIGNVQYGIISHTNNLCGTDEFPGIYTNVERFLDFINDITKGR